MWDHRQSITRILQYILLLNVQLAAEQLYGHDILLDEHTVLFTEGTKEDIEGISGTPWSQRFPFIHIEESDSCEIFGCCCYFFMCIQWR